MCTYTNVWVSTPHLHVAHVPTHIVSHCVATHFRREWSNSILHWHSVPLRKSLPLMMLLPHLVHIQGRLRCLEGPVSELPSCLTAAFSQVCSSSSTAHTTQYIEEKREVLHGLGLQILSLGMWGSGQLPLSRLLLGMEPITLLNVETADDSKLQFRQGLEALDCVFFITAIFLSVGYVQTPYSPPKSPVSWVPYTVLPSNLPSKLNRTIIPELVH